MLHPLDSRDGLTRYAVTSHTDLDLPALLSTMEEAWRIDYHDQVRLDFDAAFLYRLMAAPAWVGILICTAEGQPIGFELALERTLYCRQHPLRAYYATVFTVSSHYRRRGIGRWILEGINALAFTEQGADVIFSTFHAGHAGSPTVQHAFDRIPDWSVERFHTSPIWSRRLDRDPFPPLASPIVVTPVTLPSTDAHGVEPLAADTRGSALLPNVDTLTTQIRRQHQVAFGLDGSFGMQYLRPHAVDADTFWYDFDHGATCLISFSLVNVIRNDRRLGAVGQMQTMHAHQCTPQQIQQALQHLGVFFQDKGCFATTLFDQGVIPHDVLHALRFHATDDHVVFAVRGPRAAVQPFATVQPPFFIDFI